MLKITSKSDDAFLQKSHRQTSQTDRQAQGSEIIFGLNKSPSDVTVGISSDTSLKLVNFSTSYARKQKGTLF